MQKDEKWQVFFFRLVFIGWEREEEEIKSSSDELREMSLRGKWISSLIHLENWFYFSRPSHHSKRMTKKPLPKKKKKIFAAKDDHASLTYFARFVHSFVETIVNETHWTELDHVFLPFR